MTDDPRAAPPDAAPRARITDGTDGRSRGQLETHLATAEWHLRRVIEIARTVQPLELTAAEVAGVDPAVIDEESMRFTRTAARVHRHAERAQVTLDILAKHTAALRWEFER